VYVSTDSDEIEKYVCRFGFNKLRVIRRSDESSTDTASTELCMIEFAQKYSFTNIALVQATSPLVTPLDLKKGFNTAEQDGVDSALSVVRQKRFLWNENDNGMSMPVNYDYTARPRRQDFDGFLVENGAFYITSRESLLKTGCRLSGNIKAVEMPEYTYIELDEQHDWHAVEAILSAKLLRGTIMPEIKMFLTDCDGTLTDGGMYYTVNGEEMKKFNTRDGAGLRMLKERGIITGIITGETAESVKRRGEKIGVDEIIIGSINKVEDVKYLCNKYSVSIENVVFVGDDLNDYDVMLGCGFRACPVDAVENIRSICDYISPYKGGQGVIRDVADIILAKV